MNFYDQGRITMSGPNGGRTATPILSKINISSSEDEDLCALRNELGEDLVFQGEDYQFLRELEKNFVCPIVDIKIELCCEDNTFQEVWAGQLEWNNSEWCLDTCTATLGTRTKDGFSCVTDTWKDQKNYLDIADRVTIDTLVGEVECEIVISENSPTTPPAGFGWVARSQRIIEVWTDPTDISGPPNFIQYWTNYCRECLSTAPTANQGTGWQQEGANWYRAPAISRCRTEVVEGLFDVEGGPEWRRDTDIICDILDIELDSGITIQSLFEFYLPDCCIKSDFFGINPDGTAPNNQAYQFANQWLQNIVFFSGSDVARASGTNAINANTEEEDAGDLNLKKIWLDLKKFYGLKMVHEKDTGCIRIEHISYRKNRRVLDITKIKDGEYLEGTWCYKRKLEDFPFKELFTYPVLNDSLDWDGANITYDSSCTSDEENECKLDILMTNIGGFYDNEESFDEVKDKLFMVSITDGVINTCPGVFSNTPILNGPLAWPKIIQNLHIWDRPLQQGTMNGQVFQFISTSTAREQKEINIKIKCDDYIKFFCEPLVIKTQFGKGEIKNANWCFPSNALTVNPFFQ